MSICNMHDKINWDLFLVFWTMYLTQYAVSEIILVRCNWNAIFFGALNKSLDFQILEYQYWTFYYCLRIFIVINAVAAKVFFIISLFIGILYWLMASLLHCSLFRSPVQLLCLGAILKELSIWWCIKIFRCLFKLILFSPNVCHHFTIH